MNERCEKTTAELRKKARRAMRSDLIPASRIRAECALWWAAGVASVYLAETVARWVWG